MTITLQHALCPVCQFIPVKSKFCTNYELRIGVELWVFFHKEGKTRFINIIHISQNRLPWGRNVYGHLNARNMNANVSHHWLGGCVYFLSLQESVYSLFWAMFGLFNLNNIKILHPYKERQEGDEMHDFPWNPQTSTTVVETTGYILFAAYDVAATIVLVNMLIAMMTHSFEAIQVLD